MRNVERETSCKVQACEECAERCSVLHGNKTQFGAPRSFFKIMLDSTLKGPMCLPPRFASRARNLVDQFSYLEDISGRRWTVKLSNVEGSLAFEHGWRKFVLDHSLEFGDLLLFRYNDSHFLVEAFDRSACEKLNFLEAEIGSSQKGKQARNREKVEPLHPKNTITSFGVSKENSENPHKRQRVSRSDTRESPPECSNSLEGSRRFDHQSSCRNLKSSVTKRGWQVKRNTPNRILPSVRLPSSHKDSGHANARKVVSSTIHKVPMKKPCYKSKSPASEELHQEENLCRGDVIVLDSDSEGMETEPASTRTSSKHDNGSKRSSDEPEVPVGVSYDHSPKRRDLRGKSSIPCQSERASDDLDELCDVHGEDSSIYVQDVKSSSASSKLPKSEIVLNNSVAKNMAKACSSTGKAFHHSSDGISERICNALGEPFHVTGNSSDAEKNARIQGTVNLSNSKMVEGKGNTVDRGSTSAENSFFGQSCLRETYDASETPSKIIFNDMINEDDAGKIRIFTSKLPVFVTEDNGNTGDLDRSLRVVKTSLDCYSAAKRTCDALEKLATNILTVSEIEELKTRSCTTQDNNVEMKVDNPQGCMIPKDTVMAHGDVGIGNMSLSNAAIGYMGNKCHNGLFKLNAANEKLSYHRSISKRSLDGSQEPSYLIPGDLLNKGVIELETGNEQSAGDSPVTCEPPKVSSVIIVEDSISRPIDGSQEPSYWAGDDLLNRDIIMLGTGSEETSDKVPEHCEPPEGPSLNIVKDPMSRTTRSGTIPDVVGKTDGRKCNTEEVKGVSKTVERNFHSEAMHLAEQHIGQHHLGNRDVTNSRAGIEQSAIENSTTWKALEPLSFISDKELLQAIISEKGPDMSVLEAGERKHQTEEIDRELNTAGSDVHCNSSLAAHPLEAEYVEAMPLAVQSIIEHSSGNGVTIKSSAGSECSAYDTSKTCEILEEPELATQSGNISHMSMLEPRERSFQTKEVKREPKCAGLALNFEDSLVGAILGLDTVNAEAVDLADQQIGEYLPANGDVNKSRTGIECAAYESSNTCKAPEVPSYVSDSLTVQAAEIRSTSYLETRKRKCQMQEVERETNSEKLDFNFEDGSSGTFLGPEADCMETVNDQHIGKHPAGNEHKLVPEEPLIKESKHCKSGPSPVRYECLVCVETLSRLDLPSDFPMALSKRRKRFDKSVIVLCDSNMSLWPILYYEIRNFQKSFRSGWKYFAAANDIREGDVCLIEVTDELLDLFQAKLRKQPDIRKVK